MQRRIDSLGRLVIPMEYRREKRIEDGDAFTIEVVPGGILFSPVKHSCAVCGTSLDLAVVDGVALCKGCVGRFHREANL